MWPADERYDYPIRVVVYIDHPYGGKKSHCSGVLINPDTVMTAGECVAPGGKGEFYSRGDFRIYAGRRGNNDDWAETGCPRALKATRLYSVKGWVNSKNENTNYGAIKLNCAIGEYLGWSGIAWVGGSLEGLPIGIGGYPSDKGNKNTFVWLSGGEVSADDARFLFYRNDTSAGEIGAPVATTVFAEQGCEFCAVGINTEDRHGSGNHGRYNHGVRITEAVFNNYVKWLD